MRAEHNHPIPSCRATYSVHREQPAEVMNLIAQTLSLSTANPVETVMQILQVNGITNVLKKDIYNIKSIFFKNEASKEMYAFILNLQEKGYFVRFTVDSENRICSVLFTHEEAIKESRTIPESIVIDASYKTNMHKFSAASAWVNNELETTYTWAFEQLKESIWPTAEHGYPEVFVTDNDKAIHNAIKAVFPLSDRLLCFVHIQKNFITNIEETFTSESPAHRNILELQLEEAFKKIAFCKTEEEMNKALKNLRNSSKLLGIAKTVEAKE